MDELLCEDSSSSILNGWPLSAVVEEDEDDEGELKLLNVIVVQLEKLGKS